MGLGLLRSDVIVARPTRKYFPFMMCLLAAKNYPSPSSTTTFDPPHIVPYKVGCFSLLRGGPQLSTSLPYLSFVFRLFRTPGFGLHRTRGGNYHSTHCGRLLES